MKPAEYASKIGTDLAYTVTGKFQIFYATGAIQSPNRTKKRTLICLGSTARLQRVSFMNQLGYRDMHVVEIMEYLSRTMIMTLQHHVHRYRDAIIHPDVINDIYLKGVMEASANLNDLIKDLHR